MMANDDRTVIDLNVGGYSYSTTLKTINSESNNFLIELINGNNSCKDSKEKIFIDRDGKLFRFILDFLRNKSVLLPENFYEKASLRREAEFFKLENMVKLLDNEDISFDNSSEMNLLKIQPTTPSLSRLKANNGGCITIGYRGTFSNGRDGMNDVKFRKISRILVCGRVQLCREVFGETLNESRDPDHGVPERYTSRFFLKHTFLEQAFDLLVEAGFSLTCAAASGTSNQVSEKDKLLIPDIEESKWLHYNEFVWIKN